MFSPSIFSLLALISLLPATILPWLREPFRKVWFWPNLALALVGPMVWTWAQMSGAWSTALSADLWVTIAVTLVLFAMVSAVEKRARPLAILVYPYLMLLGLLASLSASHAGAALDQRAPAAWLDSHILVSVALLGLLTLAATGALAAFLQARTLKLKRPNGLSQRLPSVNDSEKFYEILLILSEAVLAVGIATGMATQYGENGRLLMFSHKTLFSLLAFVLIGALIAGRRWGGVRGKSAVRVMLIAYSFILLGYFGVKFVRQVLL